jgi:hypothetical protein
VAVLLRLAAGTVFLDVKVEGLGDAVLRLDIVAAERLRAVVELDFRALADPRQGSKPVELVLQAVLAWMPRTKIRSFLLW